MDHGGGDGGGGGGDRRCLAANWCKTIIKLHYKCDTYIHLLTDHNCHETVLYGKQLKREGIYKRHIQGVELHCN